MTMRSLSAQGDQHWNAVMVANHGADLPSSPDRFNVVWVDFPPNQLPKSEPSDVDHQAIRLDKGSRILAGLVATKPAGHVMTVDYDDLVSCQLAGFVAAHPDSNGWYFDNGYLFSGGNILYTYPHGFYDFCGTSHIVRADLLNIPERFDEGTREYVCRTLGSHKFIKADLESRDTPLKPLPFPGAIYRIGHSDATSCSSDVIGHFINRHALRHPARLLQNLTRYRFLTRAVSKEFVGGIPY
jgi:hypothetical protein